MVYDLTRYLCHDLFKQCQKHMDNMDIYIGFWYLFTSFYSSVFAHHGFIRRPDEMVCGLSPKAMVKYELRALKQIGLIGCGGFGTVTLQRSLPEIS